MVYRTGKEKIRAYDCACRKKTSTGLIVEVLGPTVEFLTSQDDFSVMKGTVPSGVFVPLHHHPDIEDFVIISGEMECLRLDAEGHEWIVATVGDYVHVPGGAWHAWRNNSTKPCTALFFTTNQMERGFREAGRPLGVQPSESEARGKFAVATSQPPTPQELARFAAIFAKCGVTTATAEENAKVGLSLGWR